MIVLAYPRQEPYVDRMLEVGVVGASGFTGAELLRLVSGHPEMEVVVVMADTQAGTPIAELYPSLAGAYGDRRFESLRPRPARRARPRVPRVAPRRGP